MTENNQNIEVCVQAENFYPFIAGVASLADEGSIAFSREGMSISTMDPSSIAMIVAKLSNNHCTKYEVGKEPISIGLNLENLMDMIPKKDAIIKITRKSNTRLELKIDSNGQSETIEVPIIDVKKQPGKEPKIEYTARIELDTKTLKDIIRKADIYSVHLTMTSTQENLTFYAKGDAGTMNNAFGRAKFPTKYDINGSKPVIGSFNLDYLKRIIKTAQKDALIEIAYKTEDPIRISYMAGMVSLCYYLAPYMET